MPPSEHAGAASVQSDMAALRPLGPWLRMLWDIELPVRPLAVDHPDGGEATGPAPCLRAEALHLPPAPAGLDAPAQLRWYQAAASHAAAHRVFSRASFERAGTAPITQAIAGVLEDARAEALAARELPGLARLWAGQHQATPALGTGFEALLLRLSRALGDAGYDDPHPWIRKARSRFWQDASQQVLAEPDPRRMRQLASELGHDLGQMRMAFNPRTYRPGPDYRDDNGWLWREAGDPQAERLRIMPVLEDAGTPAGDPATWGEQRTPSELRRHPEWDARIGLLRRDWCAVWLAAPAPLAAPSTTADDVLAAALVRRLRCALAQHWPRQLPATEGEELDVAQAVQEAVLRRAGRRMPRSRPWLRSGRVPVRGAALLLMDTSASTAHPVAGGASALSLQKRQAGLLARSLAAAGWRVAVQGFSSDGRHRVTLRRVLDFDEPWDAPAAARLDALQPGQSTRLGAVLRDATRQLRAQPAGRRWVLVLGDAEPHDIDVLDDRLLVADARHARRQACVAGVAVACLLPQPAEAADARRVFGPRHVAPARTEAELPRALARLLPGLQSL